MTRFHIVYDASTGQTTQVPFSSSEETARDAAEASAVSTRLDAIVAEIDQTEDILRALVLVLIDELNLHSATIAAMLTASTNATSLNDFKNRMSQIPAIPQRTTQQLRTAIRNKLGT